MKKEELSALKFFIGVVIFLIFISLIGRCDFFEEGTTQSQYKPLPKVYINQSYGQLKAIFRASSKYTDLQKDKIFDEQYKGKYVWWEGKVRDVDTSMLNNLRLYVNVQENFLFDDYVVVYMNKNQYDKLIKLNKNYPVTFSAKFDKYTTTLGLTFYFEDGEIVS